MSPRMRAALFLVCDTNPHTRRIVAEVLAGAGFERVEFAADGGELLQMTADLQPRIVITSSRIPGLSGLEFTRMVRAGYGRVDRALSVIVMTDTPTESFLKAAREAGVDEMLVRPFNGAALTARVEAVLLRPRRFVESATYVGPCRRRRMLDEYGGPLRRFTDPAEESEKPPWEAEANRALVRQCIARVDAAICELISDRTKMRDAYAAVREAEQLADDVCDPSMGDAARSLSRYISAVGASTMPDGEVLRTHVEAMQTLCALGSAECAEREQLVKGLVAVVDKRLGRKSTDGAPQRAA